MAAGCRRLAALLARNLGPTACKVHQRSFATLPSCFHPEGYITRIPALSRAAPTTCYSTKVTAPTDEVVEEPPGIFKRAWRWLLDSDDLDTDYKMSEEERQERDEIMSKVQEMYFANPPIEPNVETYKEVMAVLIKYDDRHGVDILWRLMPEMKIEPDEELTSIVTTFLERTKDKEYLQ